MTHYIFYLTNASAGLLDHVTPSLPVRNGDIGSRVLIESKALSWWSPSILHGHRMDRPRQQPGRASGVIFPKSHDRGLGESGQQPRLSPGESRLEQL
ncbi:hypothetical protein TNCV_1423291 [Trichonephila clavipes]|nr:hypothetical protein TNCV_1423291 [Trichonephila clavipes]